MAQGRRKHGSRPAGEAGSLVASKYSLMFERLYDRLAGHPESCPARPKLGAHIRVAVVLPYLVIYQHPEGGDTVSIVRVLHGRHKLPATFCEKNKLRTHAFFYSLTRQGLYPCLRRAKILPPKSPLVFLIRSDNDLLFQL
jgi:plasmid stabilization system protein ParE